MAITTNNLISRQTVGSAGAASITFSNIPQTFTDLKIVISSRCDQAGVAPVFGKLNFNGSTSSYTYRRIYGDGTDVASSSGSLAYVSNITGTGATANTFGSDDIYIPNYGSANYKSYSVDTVIENNASTVHTALYTGLWSNTAAITSLSVLPSTGNYSQYTTVSLYGISSNTTTQNTSIPSATGGDIITTDGTYWYHQFLYSGTFTPLKALTADYLVLAGGGGTAASAEQSGGGGAGGMRCTVTATGGGGSLESALSLLAQAYTVTVGAGGGTSSNGSNSVFSTITATGGGVGAVRSTQGGSGGSGGGGGDYSGTAGARTASPVQGFNGGNGGSGGEADAGGGGGGAGSVGLAPTSGSPGGLGGNGAATSITGSSVTYAQGGKGGDATGGSASLGNSGKGGDAGPHPTIYPGGSGIVVVRYAV